MATPKPSSAFSLDATYGKQSVPVFKIRKETKTHDVLDLMVTIMLRGDVSKSWLTGENSQIVPTETQKNTCYALALTTDFDCAEDYAIALGKDMLARHAHINTVTMDLDERLWERVVVNGAPHSHVFMSARDPIKRTAHVEVRRGGAVLVRSGVRDLRIMKTTQSGFAGYIKDKYTNLQPVAEGTTNADRVMCTEMVAEWTYTNPVKNFRETNKAVLDKLIEHFSGPADTGIYSKSVQETAYRMGTKVLETFPAVADVYIATPNIHHYPYPLEQFGLKNPNVVFQSTDCHTTASGRIETRVSRAKAKL